MQSSIIGARKTSATAPKQRSKIAFAMLSPDVPAAAGLSAARTTTSRFLFEN
ncbi:MAG: hypothetical protein R3D63_09515 [Paracoccaceae bacterium]